MNRGKKKGKCGSVSQSLVHTCFLGHPESRVFRSDAAAKHWASRVEFTDADIEDLDAQDHQIRFLLWQVQAVRSLLPYVGSLIRSQT